MNNKHLILRRFTVFTAMLSMAVSLFGCATDIDTVKAAPEAYQNALDLNEGENEITASGRLKMSIDKESMAVSLLDESTGKVWRTNPDGLEEDSLAYGASIDMLKAQLQIVYYDTKGNVKTMNSYTDCVKLGQVKTYSIDGGIAVSYELGDTTRDESDIPAKISDTRFQTAVLEKLSADDASEMRMYYKFYKAEDMWSIRPQGKNNLTRVLELFDLAGYTSEDLETDNAQFGISALKSKKPLFKITLEYKIEDGALVVSIPSDRIGFLEDFPLYQIKLLENFVSAKSESEGYILVPDGSGALIKFNQSVTSRDVISIPVYGPDAAIKDSELSAVQPANLPVFGIKENENALFGILETAECVASVEAYRAGRNNDNYAVYPVFTVCNMDLIRISGSDSNTNVPSFQKNLFEGDYRVRYVVLDSERSDYSGMAEVYRNYLIKNKQISEKTELRNVPVVAEVISGVYGYSSTLGVSHRGLIAASTFDETSEILDALAEKGIKKLDLKLSGWFNNGYRHDYPSKINIGGEIGGKNGLKKLISDCEKRDVILYPDVDMLTVYSSGNGFTPVFDAARYLDAAEAKISDISPATKMQREDNGLKDPFRYILSPGKLGKLNDSFLKAFKKYSFTGISLRTMGSELHSDFDKTEPYNRQDAENIVKDEMARISETVGRVMINSGHIYALPYVNSIVNVPVDNSGYLLSDCSVPFYQMVLHGYVDMAGPDLNSADDVTQTVLRCAEYGVAAYYRMVYQPSSFLKETELSELYRSNYLDLLPEISDSYELLKEVFEKTASAHISAHEQVYEDVFRTDYSNGVSVYVNYGIEEFSAGGIKIRPQSCSVKEG